jgi:transcriptional regulator with XRE-family HTH domain
MENPATLDLNVAVRVQALRKARGLTLDQLAALSDVSRAMISRIERAEVSATASLLARLAAALGVALADLFEDDSRGVEIIRRAGEGQTRVDPASGYVRRNVSPRGETGTTIVDVMLPPGARVAYDNLTPQPIEQFVWVLDGTLALSVAGAESVLTAGDCRRMRLDAEVVFENRTEEPARYAVVIVPVRSLA